MALNWKVWLRRLFVLPNSSSIQVTTNSRLKTALETPIGIANRRWKTKTCLFCSGKNDAYCGPQKDAVNQQSGTGDAGQYEPLIRSDGIKIKPSHYKFYWIRYFWKSHCVIQWSTFKKDILVLLMKRIYWQIILYDTFRVLVNLYWNKTAVEEDSLTWHTWGRRHHQQDKPTFPSQGIEGFLFFGNRIRNRSRHFNDFKKIVLPGNGN